jgi:hypothetical protein
VGESDEALGHAPEYDLRNAGSTVGPDHEQVRARPPSHARNLLVWRAVEKKRGGPNAGLPCPVDQNRKLLLSVLSGLPVDRFVGRGDHESEVAADGERHWRQHVNQLEGGPVLPRESDRLDQRAARRAGKVGGVQDPTEDSHSSS